jgi:hypothetical protein
MSRSVAFRFTLATLAVVMLAAAADTSARAIRVEAGAGGYEFSGEAWNQPETALLGNAFVAGTLPFTLNAGGSSLSNFCMYANGTIGFSSNCNAAAANLLQPLGADWIVDPEADRVFVPGSVTYTTGRLARGTIPEDPEDAPLAVRFHWSDVTCAACNGATYSFQAILIDLGNGDFDIEFNFTDIPAGVGISQIVLGSTLFESSGPFSSATDFDFRFRDGVLVGGTAVAEPGVLGLLLAAGLGFAAARRRRA